MEPVRMSSTASSLLLPRRFLQVSRE